MPEQLRDRVNECLEGKFHSLYIGGGNMLSHNKVQWEYKSPTEIVKTKHNSLLLSDFNQVGFPLRLLIVSSRRIS